MDKAVRRLYINLLGFKISPRQIFTDWNKYRAAATSIGHRVIPKYPEYVRMAVRYEVK